MSNVQDWETTLAPLLNGEQRQRWDASAPEERASIIAEILRSALAVPAMTRIAQFKLDSLLESGYQISGYAIEKPDPSGATSRGAVTVGGMVLWWHGKLDSSGKCLDLERLNSPVRGLGVAIFDESLSASAQETLSLPVVDERNWRNEAPLTHSDSKD